MAIIFGTSGDDFPLLGTPGDDEIYGLHGDDGLGGGDGNDLLDGGAGDDNLNGGNGVGDDQLFGGDGNDFMRGGLGNDLLDGGSDRDRVSFFNPLAVSGITVDLNIAGAQNTGQGMDTFVDVEHVSGTQFDDKIVGNGEDNWLWAGGNSTGLVGNDTISGGGGNDLISVGNGDHVLDGGSGTDTFALQHNGTDIGPEGGTVSLALQGAVQDTDQGMMVLSSFENLSGSPFDDTLIGDDNANLLAGSGGSDMLSGGDGDDKLYGDGNIGIDNNEILLFTDLQFTDELDGNDVLDGGKGNDFLAGGGGDDVLTGGQHADIFHFGFQAGNDVVTDFQNARDKLHIDSSAGVLVFEDLSITKVGKDVLIGWGDGSVLLQDINIHQIDPSDFIFG